MNVLLLEDRGSVRFYLEEWLTENGHNVLSAFTPNAAQSHWRDRETTPVHCIILDLQVPTTGLDDAQKARSEDGLLSGWIWFSECVLPDEPKMRQRTIIHSGYVDALKRRISSGTYRGLIVVPKTVGNGSARAVVRYIGQIARLEPWW